MFKKKDQALFLLKMICVFQHKILHKKSENKKKTGNI